MNTDLTYSDVQTPCDDRIGVAICGEHSLDMTAKSQGDMPWKQVANVKLWISESPHDSDRLFLVTK